MNLTELAHDLGGTLTDKGLIIEGDVAMRWRRSSPHQMAADMQAAIARGQAWHDDRRRARKAAIPSL